MASVEISSIKNPKVKNLALLQKAGERREQGLFVIEGVREVSLALQGNFEIAELFKCSSIYLSDPNYPIDESGLQVHQLSEQIFSKLAYREGTGGVLAVAKTKPLTLQHMPRSQNPVYLVLESIEKPGNMGAMLRTADAAGVDGVIVCHPSGDIYNPNVIRSSVGCFFTVPLALATGEEAVAWLAANGITIFAAALAPDARPCYQHSYLRPCAFVLGAEATGLSGFWLQQAHHKVVIPMRGKIDSMNVSNAAAVLVFEAMRQRGD